MNRVLLVEDHVTFRELLTFMFDREGEFEVVGQAGSLAEAHRMLEGVDLAVVDLNLPDGDGTELISELRAANPHSMALILTASADREAHARAVEAGACGVLHKSVRIKEVVGAARCLVAGLDPHVRAVPVAALHRRRGDPADDYHPARLQAGELLQGIRCARVRDRYPHPAGREERREHRHQTSPFRHQPPPHQRPSADDGAGHQHRRNQRRRDHANDDAEREGDGPEVQADRRAQVQPEAPPPPRRWQTVRSSR